MGKVHAFCRNPMRENKRRMHEAENLIAVNLVPTASIELRCDQACDMYWKLKAALGKVKRWQYSMASETPNSNSHHSPSSAPQCKRDVPNSLNCFVVEPISPDGGGRCVEGSFNLAHDVLLSP